MFSRDGSGALGGVGEGRPGWSGPMLKCTPTRLDIIGCRAASVFLLDFNG